MKQFVVGVVVALGAAAGLLAQSAAPGTQPARSGAREQVQARYNIFVMEGVLERAVEHGADQVRRQVRRVMPDMLLVSGSAEARGFRLDGYGVFFDVEVPLMRRSMAWTLRTMIEEHGVSAASALQQIKSYIESKTPDAREKANLMLAVRQLELQVGAPVPPAGGPSPRAAAQPGAPQPGAVTSLQEPAPQGPQAARQPADVDVAFLEDPNATYEREVINALKDAMLDHSGPIRVGPDEWLTVAARDNEHRDRLVPGDPYDLATIVLRIKGSDLAAFRSERISREEALKRVEVREF